MPAAAVGAAGILVSAYQANQAQGAARDAANRQQEAMDRDMAFRQQQYQDYLNMYDKPLLEPLREKAQSEGPLNIGPNWAKIQTGFDDAGRNLERYMAKTGNLGSGLDRSSRATLESGRVASLADAWSKGLQSRDDLRMRLAAIGRQMPQQAGAVMEGNANQGAFWGGRMGQAAGAAAAGWQGVGAGLGTLGQIWGKSMKPEGDSVAKQWEDRSVQQSVNNLEQQNGPWANGPGAPSVVSPSPMVSPSPEASFGGGYADTWNTLEQNANGQPMFEWPTSQTNFLNQ
jgi:hypothetical protein